MTSREELTGFVDDLYLPQIASGGLVETLDLGKVAIKGSILSLASGDSDDQPDLIAWMEKRGMLSDDGTDAPEGESVLADDYGEYTDAISTKKREIDREALQVKDSALEAFNQSNTTFRAIEDRVGELESDLRSIDERTDDEGKYLPLKPGAERRAETCIVRAMDDVYTLVDNATDAIKDQEQLIDNSRPQVSNVASGGNGSPGNSAGGSSSAASQASTASYDPTAKGTAEGIVGVVNDELGLGVREGANNSVDRPYNINDEWCASFATYAWDQAGYDVEWTNKNKVSNIWDDAHQMGLATTDVGQAKPGDMIIFEWDGDGEEDHVGIVESVDGGKITTIEGNTNDGSGGDGVYRKQHDANSPNVVGFVKPPEQTVAV